MTEQLTETFVAKVDAFAASLNSEDQAMFVDLLTSDDGVAGFGAGVEWPGLQSLGIWKAPAGTDSAGRIADGPQPAQNQRIDLE